MMLNAVIGLMGGYDADAQAYFSQLSGSPTKSFKDKLDAFVRQLKRDDNWKFDRLWLHGGVEAQQHARVSIVNPTSTQLTEFGGLTWGAKGYTGNGTNAYLKTGYIPSAGVKFQRNDASIGVYSQTNTAITRYDIGASDSTSAARLGTRSAGDNIIVHLNSSTNQLQANTDSRGLIVLNRLTDNAVATYKNGTLLASQFSLSNARPTTELYLLALNSSGVAGGFSPRQISLSFVASGGLDHLKFYNAVQQLATDLGFNV